ncbi:MAG: TlpA family protein disulfide reductase [Planctomycetes bacterium]|nr:TlpA family protein disulfide reductase [Planctomycetota bacterium]
MPEARPRSFRFRVGVALALLAAGCGEAVVVGTSVDAPGARVGRTVDPRSLSLASTSDGRTVAWLSLRGTAFRFDVAASDPSRPPTIDVVRGEGGAAIARLTGAWTLDSANPLARVGGVATLRLPSSGASDRPYSIDIAYEGRANRRGARLTVEATLSEFGEVVLGGRAFRYALRDANADGSYADLDHLDFAFDRDGDDGFDGGDGESIDPSEPFDLGTGAFAVRSVSDDGTRVEFVTSSQRANATPFLGRGDVAPSVAGTGIDGRPVSFGTSRGRRTLVVFWASWCHECRDELVEITARWDEFQPGFDGDVVGVTIDTDLAKAQEFARSVGLRFPSLRDGDASHSGWSAPLLTAYGIRSLPAAVIVGADGRVERRRAAVLEFLPAR